MNKTGGGRFNPSNRNIHFIAANTDKLRFGSQCHDYILFALNELKTPTDLARLDQVIQDNKIVFIDSGVYNLAMEHAKKHHLSHDEGLLTPIHEIDGFDILFDRYVELIGRVEADIWGYVEIDLGGREQKIKTRDKLESLGLRPIPVYHPLNDGWDYFDYLAQRYDRICFGNIVQAEPFVRKRLLATMWERRQDYPDLWVHLLGLTPNELLNAYPSDSSDSSSWIMPLKFANSMAVTSALKPFGDLSHAYIYVKGEVDSEVGSNKACKISAYSTRMDTLNWQNHLAALAAQGIHPYAKTD